MYTIQRTASNNNAQTQNNVQVIEVNHANMQTLLAKKYTFTLPVNPLGNTYEIAIGGFNLFNAFGTYAVDSTSANITPLITSPNFPTANTGSLGFLFQNFALQQMAQMLSNTPHLVAGMRASYDSSFAAQQGAFALSYFSTLRNSFRQATPYLKAFSEAITVSRQDFNDQASDFIFDTPVILDGNSFLNYGTPAPTPPAVGGVTIQIALISAMELANIKSHEQFLNIMRQVQQQCFCND